MKILIDTNVHLSGHLWEGRCAALLDHLARRDDCVLITSKPLLDELYEKLVAKFQFSDSEASASSRS